MSSRVQIITTARRWLATPFHHQARLKHVGCDCLGLVIGVALELGIYSRQGMLISDIEIEYYSHRPDSNKLKQGLDQHLIRVDFIEPADILLLNFAGNPQHLAFFAGDSIIHAYAPCKRVVEHRFSDEWWSRVARIYRFFEVVESQVP